MFLKYIPHGLTDYYLHPAIAVKIRQLAVPNRILLVSSSSFQIYCTIGR